MNFSSVSEWLGNVLILLFLVGIPTYGFFKKVPIYEKFVEGAKEGFPTFLRIFPYMLAMLVAIGMLRTSGVFDLLSHLLSPVFSKMNVPAEIVPLAIIRPFSASAALAVLADLLHAQGANAPISHLGAIVASSADTTFYIAAIYFGAVMIRNARHALSLSIIVDIIGMLSAIWIGQWLLK
ncbi:MAG: nucleoside recognition domain-containing protein [Coxiellaceae bacterium]|nr:nucleoside recognition domain-containing protein [Coxiellaceae bacterium]